MMADETLFRLDKKTVAVVGAASGIGEAVVKGCAAQGAHVTCLDINAEAARSVGRAGERGCAGSRRNASNRSDSFEPRLV